MLHWKPGRRFDLRLELLRSSYMYHNPGPLTDAMFAADPRQSSRTRNYFNPEIWLPSAVASWQITENTLLKCTLSGVRGERRSVLFDRVANIPDTINTSTLQYNRRQVDIDAFNSNTAEVRLLHAYKTGNNIHHLSVAVQGFYNDLNRQQQGRGTTGSDADFSIDPQFGWGRDLHLRTTNISLSVENRFVLGEFSLAPGFRYEYGRSDLSGTTSYYNPDELPNRINRKA
jgi:Fe(3+) dicitrate transport protein